MKNHLQNSTWYWKNISKFPVIQTLWKNVLAKFFSFNEISRNFCELRFEFNILNFDSFWWRWKHGSMDSGIKLLTVGCAFLKIVKIEKPLSRHRVDTEINEAPLELKPFWNERIQKKLYREYFAKYFKKYTVDFSWGRKFTLDFNYDCNSKQSKQPITVLNYSWDDFNYFK